ncbi:MAG: hypothetical protein R3C24_19020 [Cyanobacteriota/Melainabacteria group bacterium]|nr:hypothetical protein [Candidatus Obscuribacterales bacterium]
MVFEQADIAGDKGASNEGADSGRSRLAGEYIQLAKADPDAMPDTRSDNTGGMPGPTESASKLSPEIEAMKTFYPVAGEHFDEYKSLIDKNDPKAYLDAEPTFRKLVDDSDKAFETQETSTKEDLELLGPGLPEFKREYLSANKALGEEWDKLPQQDRDRLTQTMQEKGIPLSQAAKGDYPELSSSAQRVETVFNSNLETVMKLTGLQSWLTNAYQQKLIAREMHGDTLSFGAGAADDATARSMHADKAKRDQEVKTLYEAGPPNIFDYIKD